MLSESEPRERLRVEPPQSVRRAADAVPAPVVDGWTCENCDLVNVPRRRRCSDCRTSRY